MSRRLRRLGIAAVAGGAVVWGGVSLAQGGAVRAHRVSEPSVQEREGSTPETVDALGDRAATTQRAVPVRSRPAVRHSHIVARVGQRSVGATASDPGDQESANDAADSDNVQAGDQTAPDTPGESDQGNETPNGDGPNGHADEPANRQADHQAEGAE
jgi:hypothetical protein